VVNVPRIHPALARPEVVLLPHRLSLAQNIDATGYARFAATATDSAGVVLVSRGIRDVQPFRCRRATWRCGGLLVSGWRYCRDRRREPSPVAGGWSGRLPSRQLSIWSTESGR
jgi:hypothetical protein